MSASSETNLVAEYTLVGYRSSVDGAPKMRVSHWYGMDSFVSVAKSVVGYCPTMAAVLNQFNLYGSLNGAIQVERSSADCVIIRPGTCVRLCYQGTFIWDVQFPHSLVLARDTANSVSAAPPTNLTTISGYSCIDTAIKPPTLASVTTGVGGTDTIVWSLQQPGVLTTKGFPYSITYDIHQFTICRGTEVFEVVTDLVKAKALVEQYIRDRIEMGFDP